MAMDNISLVRRFVDQIWNKGDLTAFDDLVSSKMKTHDPLLGDLEGLEASKRHVQMFRTAFPDFNVAIDDIGMMGDKVYVRWTTTGTHKGTLMGIGPTNRRGMIHGISINRFEGGKIVETYYAWDVYRLIEQLGLVPPLQTFISGKPQQPTARV